MQQRGWLSIPRNQELNMALIQCRQKSIPILLVLQMRMYPFWAPCLFLRTLTFVNSFSGSREFALSRSVSSVCSLLSRWTFIVWMEASPAAGGQASDCFLSGIQEKPSEPKGFVAAFLTLFTSMRQQQASRILQA